MSDQSNPDRAALLAIAERVEAATGPDRALDAEIALWVTGHSRPAFPYTGSLDAAVSLMPDECWFWMLGKGKVTDDDPLYCVDATGMPGSGRNVVQGRSDTSPARAVTAAALRARAEGA